MYEKQEIVLGCMVLILLIQLLLYDKITGGQVVSLW